MESVAAMVTLLALLGTAASTPLDDYVNKEDPTYEYRDLGNPFKGEGYTSYFINMTSQTWLSSSLVDRPVWWHYLVINIPDEIQYLDTAFVYVTGGTNLDGIPDITSSDCLLTTVLAFSTKTVTATLFQNPNQPIVFSEDPTKKSREEGAIIAYTWYHYRLFPDEPDYLLMLPMTKAVVRALDTTADFAAKKNSSSHITKFVVGGASKRGWATWTTGAVDKRVIGIVPIVMSELNLIKNLHHHYRSYGGWTFAISDYYVLNFTMYLDDPNYQKMATINDPYAYIDRLTMPKLVISASGDEFFLPDDSYYFWDSLKGDKYSRMLPNAGHSCAGYFTSLTIDVDAFYLSLLMNAPRPVMTWSMNQTVDGGYITMTANTKPSIVLVYHATTLTGKRRDFRLLTGIPDPTKPTPQPVIWFSEALEPQASNTYMYVAKMSIPDEGWRAFFIQATFPGPRADAIFVFTTQVNIIPNTFPFPDCSGAGCKGTLV